jgi:hypothetical protein
MLTTDHPEGSKPSAAQRKAKSQRRKRTAALAKQQKDEHLKRLSQLELHQALADERTEHDATKANDSRLRLEHNDLVTRLDDAETAVANAESRAWQSEREIIKLQEALSASRVGAQNNETWIELIAEQNQQLEAANARLAARSAIREGELHGEIEQMEMRARRLEQSLSIAYKDVEECGVLFQKNTEDWAELVGFLEKHKSQDGERIQKLRGLVMEYSSAVEYFEDEVNKLIQAAEVRIARNRLRRDKQAGRDGVQWDSQVWRRDFNSSSEENLHRSFTDGRSSPDADYERFPGSSWSVPGSSSESTGVSGSRISNLSSESRSYVQGQQSPTGLDRPRHAPSPAYFEHFSGYIPTLNTSRKRIRIAPPMADSKQGPVSSNDTTDYEVPQSNSIIRESESKGIQTDNAPLLARQDNLAASLRALVTAPKGPLSPGGKPRSLSVGDLPWIPATKAASPFERMPGSWPHEAIPNAEVNPEIASEIAHGALRLFRASIENAVPIGFKLLNLLTPSHPQCIVYPGLMALWMWQTYEQHVEWKRWERANERYMVQQLRNQYASQAGWVDSVGFGLSQWLAFDRSSFG